jgi:hypothetical protein
MAEGATMNPDHIGATTISRCGMKNAFGILDFSKE